MIRNTKAFTLIELAIALAVIGLVVLGVFQLTASMGRQAGDKQIASELKAVTDSVQAYMAQVGSTNLGTGTTLPGTPPVVVPPLAANASRQISDAEINFMELTYLPGGTDLNTPAGANAPYRIFLRRLADVNGTAAFQALVVKRADTTLSDSRGATIAAQSGANGGFVYAGANGTITGSKGGWAVAPANFGHGTPGQGTLAALVNTSGIAITSNMLSRVGTGNETANRMDAALITREGIRFELPTTGTPPVVGNPCGSTITGFGIKENQDGGYAGRMVMGTTAVSGGTPKVVICTAAQGGSFAWKAFDDYSGGKGVVPLTLMPEQKKNDATFKGQSNMNDITRQKDAPDASFEDYPAKTKPQCFWTLGVGGSVGSPGANGTGTGGWQDRYQICPEGYYGAGIGKATDGNEWVVNNDCQTGGGLCVTLLCCPF